MSSQVFRHYGHVLAPEGIAFVEEVLEIHGIGEDDVEDSTEWLAKECSRQDGTVQCHVRV